MEGDNLRFLGDPVLIAEIMAMRSRGFGIKAISQTLGIHRRRVRRIVVEGLVDLEREAPGMGLGVGGRLRRPPLYREEGLKEPTEQEVEATVKRQMRNLPPWWNRDAALEEAANVVPWTVPFVSMAQRGRRVMRANSGKGS